MENSHKLKIGIVTFSCANNFGAVLQNYALSEYLKKSNLQYEVYTIDYLSSEIFEQYDPDFIPLPKVRNVRDFIHFPIRFAVQLYLKNSKKETNFIFDDFKRKNLHLTEKVTDKNQFKRICNDFDILISGSDQVLNSVITKRDWDVYSLFLLNNKIKIGYAVSAGNSKFITQEIVESVKTFAAVSVREEELQVFLSKYIASVPLVVDPVFLLSREMWDNLLEEYKNVISYKYILVYFDDKKVLDKAFYLAKKMCLRIIFLGFNPKLIGKVDFIKNAGPLDFISLIKNAECIVTSSFHATAFSIIYEKKFFCSIDSARSSRITSLLTLLGLEDSIIQNNISESESSYNWATVKEKLSNLVGFSKDWLQRVIGENRR